MRFEKQLRGLISVNGFGRRKTEFLNREHFQTVKLLRPAITDGPKLPLVPNLNQPNPSSQHFFLPSSVFSRQLGMWHPDDSHPRPSSSFNAHHAILEYQAFFGHYRWACWLSALINSL